jgi:hypothetical protein
LKVAVSGWAEAYTSMLTVLSATRYWFHDSPPYS